MDDPSDVLVPVAMYDDTDDAEQAAKALVARGFGAIVQRFGVDLVRGDDVPPSVTAQDDVLRSQPARASQIISFADPADAAGAGTKAKQEFPLKTVLIIFAIAMVVFPGLAFLISYNLGQ